ncbi:MAG: pantetheine-phosphate adenylyltransferase [Gammaproteobacteria bacterium]
MKAVFPGTFDPITKGHLDIIERAVRLFSPLIIGVAVQSNKQPCFSIQERVSFIEEAVAHLKQVQVQFFDGLLVNWLKSVQAQVIVRGVRSALDWEYELNLWRVNQSLAPEFETVFLSPASEVNHISSSLVRELLRLNGDASKFLPPNVWKKLEHGTKNNR